jgi:hypothetical protein
MAFSAVDPPPQEVIIQQLLIFPTISVSSDIKSPLIRKFNRNDRKESAKETQRLMHFFYVLFVHMAFSVFKPPTFSECNSFITLPVFLFPYIIIPMISALIFILPVQLFYVGIYY